MKINTDGVLLGAVIEAEKPASVLDIGTGTGVIALMTAQRFPGAEIDAVEIDEAAAQTAERNFKGSPFAERMSVYPISFESYFDGFPDKNYDLVISNPPFYIDSLKSPKANKTLAKHADSEFFELLLETVASQLTTKGCCWLILPVDTAELVAALIVNHQMHLQKTIDIYSYPHSQAHRKIIKFGFDRLEPVTTKLVIYETAGVYSEAYEKLLQPYFINF
ncbi:MAG: tRNA1(Val) (adenine(37)-N6)-methyltransferase [Mucilaginibacter sp.]